MAPLSLKAMHVILEIEDAEVRATLLRLLAQLGMNVSLEKNDSEKMPILCSVRESGTSIVIDAPWEECSAILTRPLRAHQFRQVMERCSLRFRQESEENVMLGGGMRLNTSRRQIVDVSGKMLCDLTEKETELLAYLQRAGANGEDREGLLAELWKYHPDAETHTLDSHLYRLRQKLAELPVAESVEITVQQGRYVLVTKKPAM